MIPESEKEDPLIHDPVMVEEVIGYLRPEEKRSGVFCDATTSTGGHAEEIVSRLSSDGVYIGLDLDESALRFAKERLSGYPARVELYRANYSRLDEVLEAVGVAGADGVLFDLGFSTFQIEDPERGFSFQKKGPLDMRMNPEGDLTAEEIVNNYAFEELKQLILRYGEEKWADGIAKEIVKQRKQKRIKTTRDLVRVIESALPEGEKRRRNIHPATKTFQALRIAVNDELNNLKKGLETAFGCLKKGGVLVVISYHSLEDRETKRFLKYKARDCICPPDLPVCRCDKEAEVELLTGGAVRPDESEIGENPRSRSARLRAGKKITDGGSRRHE